MTGSLSATSAVSPVRPLSAVAWRSIGRSKSAERTAPQATARPPSRERRSMARSSAPRGRWWSACSSSTRHAMPTSGRASESAHPFPSHLGSHNVASGLGRRRGFVNLVQFVETNISFGIVFHFCEFPYFYAWRTSRKFETDNRKLDSSKSFCRSRSCGGGKTPKKKQKGSSLSGTFFLLCKGDHMGGQQNVGTNGQAVRVFFSHLETNGSPRGHFVHRASADRWLSHFLPIC